MPLAYSPSADRMHAACFTADYKIPFLVHSPAAPRLPPSTGAGMWHVDALIMTPSGL